jgi:hypothetical protein
MVQAILNGLDFCNEDVQRVLTSGLYAMRGSLEILDLLMLINGQ